MKAILGSIMALAILAGTVVRAQFPSPFTAVTPQQLNYQGRLTTPDGTPYSNLVYDIEFRVWTAASGGTTPLWGARYSVYAKEGYFNVILGAPGGVALTCTYNEIWKALWFNPSSPQNKLYLGIKVLKDFAGKAIPPADAQEAFPRQQLLCSPFAERAQMAQYARESIDDFLVRQKLTVNGLLDANLGLDVSGGATVLSGNLTHSGGTATFNNGIVVNTAAATLNKGLDVSGAKTYLRLGAEVSGLAELKGGVTVTGDGTFKNNVTVSNNVTINNIATIGQLTLRGFGSTDDLALDFGSSYSLYADSTGGGASGNRLWLKTPTGGEVKLGGSTRMDNFRVLGNNMVFDGGNVDFVNVNTIKVRSAKPIVVKRFTLGDNIYEMWKETNYSTTDWSAMIVGFNYGYADIEENNSRDTFVTRMEKSGGTWKVHYRGHYQNSSLGDPVIDVMFIRNELVTDDER